MQIQKEFELEHEHLVLLRNHARFRTCLPVTIFEPKDVIYVERVCGIAKPGTPGCAICGCDDESRFSSRQLKSPFGLASGKARCQKCINAGLKVGGSAPAGLSKSSKADSSEGAVQRSAASSCMDSASLADTLESAQLESEADAESVARELHSEDDSVREGSKYHSSVKSRELSNEAEKFASTADVDSAFSELHSQAESLQEDEEELQEDSDDSECSESSTKSMAMKLNSYADAHTVKREFHGADIDGRPMEIEVVEDEDRYPQEYQDVLCNEGLVRISNLPTGVHPRRVCDMVERLVPVILVWTVRNSDGASDASETSEASCKSMAAAFETRSQADEVAQRFNGVEFKQRELKMFAVGTSERDVEEYGDIPLKHGLVHISNVSLEITNEMMEGCLGQVAPVLCAWELGDSSSEGEEREASVKRG